MKKLLMTDKKIFTQVYNGFYGLIISDLMFLRKFI